jgi:hypothetical protein
VIIVRKRLLAIALTLLTAFGLSVASSPEASARVPHTFGVGYTSPYFRGGQIPISTNNWFGACDASGYVVSVGRGIESLRDLDGRDACNYVWLIDSYGRVCGNGAFYMTFVGTRCVGRIAEIRVFHDYRSPQKSK